MAHPEPWHERRLGDGEWLRADFAELTLLVHSTVEEWRVAVIPDLQAPGELSPDSLPDGVAWTRWDRAPGDTGLCFRPVFPDRPVIVRPREVLNLSPRAKALFHIGIPAWIELSAQVEGSHERLSAWPSTRLSNSWHGDPTAGELCYATKTRARRRLDAETWAGFNIITTVEISNQSTKTLPFERLFLETDHLAIFEHRGMLWSNHARIRASEGADELDGIAFSPTPFGDASGGSEISPARRGIVRRSKLKAAFSTVLGTLQDD